MPLIDSSDKTPIRSSSSWATSDLFSPLGCHDESPGTWPQNMDEVIDQSTRLHSRGSVPAIPGFSSLIEIGRGGMGIVYRAQQQRLNRPVAIKMILAGNYADPIDRMRFRLEAELTARVQHPHVVQVYEAGEHEGKPYLVMEWIDGGTLADQLRGKRITPRSAARLMITLAKAVHAAHCRGVVHRDLKPNNILLATTTGSGRSHIADSNSNARQAASEAIDLPLDTWHLKVTDFGLAKPAGSGSKLTGSQFVVGTPAYMAPEQATNQEIGPAVDIYALGVLLFEMLTGRTPFMEASPMAVLMKAMNDEPPTLRSVVPSLPRDLDAICSKCLRKSPEERYATALELAEDLENYLQGKPLKARPLTKIQQVIRWARRHKMLSGLAASLAIVTSAALAVITYFYFEANAERNKAETEKGLAQRAEGNARLAAAHSTAMKDFLLHDLLQVARPTRKGLKVTVKEALDIAAARIDESFAKNPELAALMHDELGYTYFQLDQFREAEKHQRQALALYVKTAGPDARETIAIRHNIFSNLVQQARYEEADAEFDDLFSNSTRVLGEEDPETLSMLSSYARMQEKRGRLPQAISAYRRLADIYDKQTGKVSQAAIVTKANLANALRETGQHEEAGQLMKTCLMQANEQLGADHQITLGLQQNEALHLLRERRFTEAEPLLKSALNGFERSYGANAIPTLTIMNNLAGVYEGQGKYTEAITLKKQVVAGRSKILGPEHPDTIVVRSNLHCAEMDEALRSNTDSTRPYTDLQELLKLRVKVSGSDHPDTLLQSYTLGYFSNRRGDHSAAVSYLLQAAEGYQRTLGEKHEMTMQSIMNLGGTYAKMKNYPEAEKVLRFAHDIVEKYQPKDHWLQGKVKSMLGQTLAQLQNNREAEPLLMKAYDIVSKNSHAAPEVVEMTILNLAEYYNARHQQSEASKWRATLAEYQKQTAHLR